MIAHDQSGMAVVLAVFAKILADPGDDRDRPIRILKRIDRSSPLLAKALCNNEAVDGEFKFFRPNPAGDGTTEHFFTIEILNGRINDIVRTSPNCIDPASSTAPPLEEVSFVFETIRWIFVPTGAEHEDTWSDNA